MQNTSTLSMTMTKGTTASKATDRMLCLYWMIAALTLSANTTAPWKTIPPGPHKPNKAEIVIDPSSPSPSPYSHAIPKTEACKLYITSSLFVFVYIKDSSRSTSPFFVIFTSFSYLNMITWIYLVTLLLLLHWQSSPASAYKLGTGYVQECDDALYIALSSILMILVFIGLETSLGLVLKYSSWGRLHTCLTSPLLNYPPIC